MYQGGRALKHSNWEALCRCSGAGRWQSDCLQGLHEGGAGIHPDTVKPNPEPTLTPRRVAHVYNPTQHFRGWGRRIAVSSRPAWEF